MPVVEVSDGMRIDPNHVYVIPPNDSLAMLHGVLHLMPRRTNPATHLPIDDFFRSLAEDRQSKAIGVVLSGTGSDGTLGLGAIKAAGGITFAQDEDRPSTTACRTAPSPAGRVDFVLPPEEIAEELVRIAPATRICARGRARQDELALPRTATT